MSDRLFDEVSENLQPPGVLCGSELTFGKSEPSAISEPQVVQDAVQDDANRLVCEQAPLLRHLPTQTDNWSLWSVIIGIVGLAFWMLIFAMTCPATICFLDILEDTIGLDGYLAMTAFILTVSFPAMTIACVAVSAIMFWRVALLLRFLIVIAMVFSVGTLFAYAFAWATIQDARDIATELAFINTIGVLTSASVGVMFQLCSPWMLSHLKTDEEGLPKVSISTLIQLTTVIAISIASYQWVQTTIEIEFHGFIVVISTFAAITGVLCCIAMLRSTPIGRLGIAMVLMTIFGLSTFFVWFCGYSSFGSPTGMFQAPIASLFLSIYGMILIGVPLWVAMAWLRACGWRCVRSHVRT